MRSREFAEVLLRKAAQDEFVMHKLISDPEAPGEAIGFHAQQAVEKMLKAVLALHAIRFGKVHELAHLLDLLRKNNLAFPKNFEEFDRLTPFAATLRYEDTFPISEGPIDRTWAADCVQQAKAWAESMMREPNPQI